MTGRNTHKSIPLPQMLALVAVQCVLFVAIGVGLWAFSGRDFTAFASIDLYQIGLGVALALGMIASGLALFKAFPAFGEKLVRDQVQQFGFLENRIGIGPIIFISACAGIGEEALFRGGLLTLAADHMAIPLAVLVTSALFAFVHLAKPVVAILIGVIGALFGFAYLVTGSLLAVMIGHALYDVWALWFIQDEMHRLGVFDQPAAQES